MTSPGVGFTLPQRGVFFGVTTMDEMLALAARADADARFGSVWVGSIRSASQAVRARTVADCSCQVMKLISPRIAVACERYGDPSMRIAG